MVTFTQGNLLEANTEALVNTVNTVGVMGKGVALMFKEAFPDNYKAYAAACKRGEVKVGEMFVVERDSLLRPRWILNFPSKQHWRNRSRMAWIDAGLRDLVRVIREKGIRSIALPPIGCGNGGLAWDAVRPRMESLLNQLDGVEVIIFEPTRQYQNVQKRSGVEKLTPARALVAEVVRRYSLMGLDCSVLEVQKLAWFLQTSLQDLCPTDVDPLHLQFGANRFGPYSRRLLHLLNGLDGSYLHCEKRLADATPLNLVEFNYNESERLGDYLRSPEAANYLPVLERTERIIHGFQSPFGLELLATIDWLLRREDCEATIPSVRAGLARWPGGRTSSKRKLALFDERMIGIALKRLAMFRAATIPAGSQERAANS